MEDLQSALQSILSDPEQMARVRAMAEAMGLQPPEASPGPAGQPPAQEAPPPTTDNGLLQLMGRLGQVHGAEERVFSALRPGASPQTGQRLDRALRAAKLSRMAGLLLRQTGAGHV